MMKRLVFKRFLLIVFAIVVFVACLPFAFNIEVGSASPSKPFPESNFVRIDGVNYHYRFFRSSADSASGNMLFIHGFSGSTFSWRSNVDFFSAQGYNVLLVDMPAFGYSDRSTDVDYSVSSNALRIWALLDSVDRGNWTIIGHSMGANVAGAMASLKPSLTEAVVFVDGGFFGIKGSGLLSRFVGSILSSRIIKRWAEYLAINRFYNYEKFEDLLSSAYGQRADSISVQGYMNPFIEVQGTASSILEMASAREMLDISPERISSPQLIIWGDHDSWIPPGTAAKMKGIFPSAQVLFINGSGHCPMETHSQAFNDGLLRFLEKKK